MMINILWVALGGGVGASLRYLVSIGLLNGASGFPFATLAVNISGSFGLAMLWLWQLQQSQSSATSLWLLLGVGVFGGFTTFSTFSLELFQLLQQQQWLKATLYSLASVLLSLFAVALAWWLFGQPLGHDQGAS